MRRWMIFGISLATCMAAVAHVQSAPQASDSWQRPASSSSVAYAGSPGTPSRNGQSAFRFKDDKAGESRFKVEGATQRSNRGPQSMCDSANAACKQERSLSSGQGR